MSNNNFTTRQQVDMYIYIYIIRYIRYIFTLRISQTQKDRQMSNQMFFLIACVVAKLLLFLLYTTLGSPHVCPERDLLRSFLEKENDRLGRQALLCKGTTMHFDESFSSCTYFYINTSGTPNIAKSCQSTDAKKTILSNTPLIQCRMESVKSESPLVRQDFLDFQYSQHT
jgi:hypothetical protein